MSRAPKGWISITASSDKMSGERRTKSASPPKVGRFNCLASSRPTSSHGDPKHEAARSTSPLNSELRLLPAAAEHTPVVYLRRVHEFRYRLGAAPRIALIGRHLQQIKKGWDACFSEAVLSFDGTSFRVWFHLKQGLNAVFPV